MKKLSLAPLAQRFNEKMPEIEFMELLNNNPMNYICEYND